VSPERIAAELRAMLSRRGRGRALELLAETRLAPVVLPELTPAAGTAEAESAWLLSARVVEALDDTARGAGGFGSTGISSASAAAPPSSASTAAKATAPAPSSSASASSALWPRPP
jgi:hypothetical protein